MHGITPRFLTSTSTFRTNTPMPTVWTVTLEWSQSSNILVMLRGRTCSYRPAKFRLGEPRPWTLSRGNTAGDIIAFFCTGPDAGGRSGSGQAAPAPSPAPSLAPSEAAARRTARPAPRSEPALTRARPASVPPRRQTRSGTASLATLFEQRTLHNLRLLALYTDVETQDIDHHLENASFFAEYAYVSTASTENHSGGGGGKLKVPNTFKEAMSLPQAA